MNIAWYWPDWNPQNCTDPPSESCSDADCPVHSDAQWPNEPEDDTP
jgi:hypothetical protein